MNCKKDIPLYGSVFDTGTIKTFIKVLYIDESKKPEPKESEKGISVK